jgi:hypothetical protein
MLKSSLEIHSWLSDEEFFERYVEIIKAREQHESNLFYRDRRIELGKPKNLEEETEVMAKYHDEFILEETLKLGDLKIEIK